MHIYYHVKDAENISHDLRSLERTWRVLKKRDGFFVDDAGDLRTVVQGFNPAAIVLSGEHDPQRAVRHIARLREWEKQLDRPRQTPVLFVDHPASPIGETAAFNAGADAYCRSGQTPAQYRVALLESLIRRSFGHATNRIAYAGTQDLLLDTKARRMFLFGEPVKLTENEYVMVEQVFLRGMATRPDIMDALYGVNGEVENPGNNISVYSRRIRDALNDVVPGAQAVLSTYMGIGYRFDVSALDALRPGAAPAVRAAEPGTPVYS